LVGLGVRDGTKRKKTFLPLCVSIPDLVGLGVRETAVLVDTLLDTSRFNPRFGGVGG